MRIGKLSIDKGSFVCRHFPTKTMSDRLYIAYYRVSTEEQGAGGHSLDAQRAAVQRYLEAHGGHLASEYTEVESGKKNNRPELQAAIQECRRHRVTLLIAKLDRLARNVHFITGLIESRVDFVCCDNPHANKVMIQMLAVFAEFERDRISERTKEGLAAAKAKGVELGKNGKHVLAPQNKAKADAFALSMVPIIEGLQAEGYTSIRKLMEALNARQIPTATESGRWHIRNVELLLKRIKGLQHSELVNPST